MNYIDGKVRTCIENKTRRKVVDLTVVQLNSAGDNIRVDYEATLDNGCRIETNVRVKVNVSYG